MDKLLLCRHKAIKSYAMYGLDWRCDMPHMGSHSIAQALVANPFFHQILGEVVVKGWELFVDLVKYGWALWLYLLVWHECICYSSQTGHAIDKVLIDKVKIL